MEKEKRRPGIPVQGMVPLKTTKKESCSLREKVRGGERCPASFGDHSRWEGKHSLGGECVPFQEKRPRQERALWLDGAPIPEEIA